MLRARCLLLDFLINITDTFKFYSKFSASCEEDVDAKEKEASEASSAASLAISGMAADPISADRQDSRINILLILNLRNIVTQNMFIVGGCEFQI